MSSRGPVALSRANGVRSVVDPTGCILNDGRHFGWLVTGSGSSVSDDQIDFCISLLCTGARWDPAACGTHEGN
jgi:hypothetical protein